MLGANCVIPARICDELSHGQAEFPKIMSQNGQNDFEDQGQWSLFVFIPADSIQDACLEQIWWFWLESVTSYRADKVKFTDRRTDRRRQRQYPCGLKVQRVKHTWFINSNITPNSAGENPIWLPLQNEYYYRYANVMQLV